MVFWKESFVASVEKNKWKVDFFFSDILLLRTSFFVVGDNMLRSSSFCNRASVTNKHEVSPWLMRAQIGLISNKMLRLSRASLKLAQCCSSNGLFLFYFWPLIIVFPLGRSVCSVNASPGPVLSRTSNLKKKSFVPLIIAPSQISVWSLFSHWIMVQRRVYLKVWIKNLSLSVHTGLQACFIQGKQPQTFIIYPSVLQLRLPDVLDTVSGTVHH